MSAGTLNGKSLALASLTVNGVEVKGTPVSAAPISPPIIQAGSGIILNNQPGITVTVTAAPAGYSQQAFVCYSMSPGTTQPPAIPLWTDYPTPTQLLVAGDSTQSSGAIAINWLLVQTPPPA